MHNINWHPSSEMLLNHAMGNTNEAESLIISSHTTYCSVCKAEVAKYENIGGLQIGSSVSLNGYKVGMVSDINLMSNKKITLPFRKELQWPYIHVDDAVSSIITVLLSQNKHNYSYNVSGPDFPSYSQVADEIKKYYKNFNPSFSKTNKIKKRESFSLKKIKKDINWTPKINIEKGINNFIIGQ